VRILAIVLEENHWFLKERKMDEVNKWRWSLPSKMSWKWIKIYCKNWLMMQLMLKVQSVKIQRRTTSKPCSSSIKVWTQSISKKKLRMQPHTKKPGKYRRKSCWWWQLKKVQLQTLWWQFELLQNGTKWEYLWIFQLNNSRGKPGEDVYDQKMVNKVMA